jgi:type VI secretion system Hcp family effector
MNRSHLNLSALLLFAALLLPLVSPAQSIYMDFKSNDLPMEGLTEVPFTTNKLHKIESVSWDIQQPVDDTRSPSGSPTSSRADFSVMTLYRKFDSTSPLFFYHTAVGSIAPNVTLYFMIIDQTEKLVEYMKVELTDIVVTSVQQSHEQGSGIPYETIALSYGSIKFTVTLDGKSTIRGWDVILNRSL